MRIWVFSIKELFTTRSAKIFFINALAFFGLVSAIVQFLSVVYTDSFTFDDPNLFLSATAILSIAYGLASAFPRTKVSQAYKDVDVKINVIVGDVLKYKGQVAIGFSDTFDTETKNDTVISSSSLQGKLLNEKFGGNSDTLDKKLSESLKAKTPEVTEKRSDKTKGKLKRYPIGTVAVFDIDGTAKTRIYALALSKMKNDLVTESSVHYLWDAIGQLWDAVYNNGQLSPIAMPVLGTGLARINALDRESLLRMLLLSFMARTREQLVCKELTIYIHPNDRKYINMTEVKAFLKHL